jgi:hypothetical protein
MISRIRAQLVSHQVWRGGPPRRFVQRNEPMLLSAHPDGFDLGATGFGLAEGAAIALAVASRHVCGCCSWRRRQTRN